MSAFTHLQSFAAEECGGPWGRDVTSTEVCLNSFCSEDFASGLPQL